jgi:uncharacterized membrane protein YfcA
MSGSTLFLPVKRSRKLTWRCPEPVAVFLENKIFRVWLIIASVTWLVLFGLFNNVGFLLDHWYYPATMVVGAFVAGSTPEGGGAVAFPVLNIFLNIDRVLARDFSLMIQSVGMTSASIFILTDKRTRIRAFRPLLWWVPIAFVGFVFGMLTLQSIRVYIIQAIFLALTASFTITYYFSSHRGRHGVYREKSLTDRLFVTAIVFAGGMCTSLFGVGADILLYTVLVTHFMMREKLATQMSVIIMASLSILGFVYRGVYEGALTSYQIQTWLCAFPVVMIMAPLGSLVLKKIDTEHMLRGVVVLNIAQLAYFNLKNPTPEKLYWSLGCTALLSAIFFFGMAELVRRRARDIFHESAEVPSGQD